MAIATWPTRTARESPSVAHGNAPPSPSAHDEAEDGQVRVRIVADDVGAKRTAVGERDDDLRRTRHDVAVREDEAVRGEEEARAAAAADIDLRDGGADDLHRLNDGARVRVEQRVVVAQLGLRRHGAIV